jgi:uncharacterized protein HemY
MDYCFHIPAEVILLAFALAIVIVMVFFIRMLVHGVGGLIDWIKSWSIWEKKPRDN